MSRSDLASVDDCRMLGKLCAERSHVSNRNRRFDFAGVKDNTGFRLYSAGILLHTGSAVPVTTTRETAASLRAPVRRLGVFSGDATGAVCLHTEHVFARESLFRDFPRCSAFEVPFGPICTRSKNLSHHVDENPLRGPFKTALRMLRSWRVDELLYRS